MKMLTLIMLAMSAAACSTPVRNVGIEDDIILVTDPQTFEYRDAIIEKAEDTDRDEPDLVLVVAVDSCGFYSSRDKYVTIDDWDEEEKTFEISDDDFEGLFAACQRWTRSGARQNLPGAALRVTWLNPKTGHLFTKGERYPLLRLPEKTEDNREIYFDWSEEYWTP